MPGLRVFGIVDVETKPTSGLPAIFVALLLQRYVGRESMRIYTGYTVPKTISPSREVWVSLANECGSVTVTQGRCDTTRFLPRKSHGVASWASCRELSTSRGHLWHILVIHNQVY